MTTKHHRGQMSEAFCTAMFPFTVRRPAGRLHLSSRGKVFANAQTGNIVLMSVQHHGWRVGRVLHYLVPLCAFALGVLAAEKMQEQLSEHAAAPLAAAGGAGRSAAAVHCRLSAAGANLLANAIVSFACAMQVQAFRKVNGYAFASTMCIGDLRSGMEALSASGARPRTAKPSDRMVRYFGIILSCSRWAQASAAGRCAAGRPGHLALSCAAAGKLCAHVPERRCGRDQRRSRSTGSKTLNQGVSLSFTLFTAMPKAPLVGELASAQRD